MSVPVFQPPQLEDLKLLCAVVDQRSFSAAAQHTGTTQPRVSRAIRRLEERLGIPLVRRSPRGIAVTAEGERYAEHGRRVLADLEAVEAQLGSPDLDAGPLRVSAPPAVCRRLLMPHLGSFCRDNSQIRLDLSLAARRVDLIEEDVDIAVRFGPLEASWRRCRRILSGRYHLYAAPSLGIGSLSDPAQLSSWPCIVLHATHLRNRWPLVIDGEVQYFAVTPALLVDDVEAMIGFAAGGVGVAVLPDFLVRREVDEGTLVRLTQGSQAATAEVFAVTTSAPPRAARLVEHLATALSSG